MDKTPLIGLDFVLTKMDYTDFDRNAVTQQLGLTPSETCAPRLSKGKINTDTPSSALEGITILPADTPPYQMLLHANWCLGMPKEASYTIDAPLQKLEQCLSEKRSAIMAVCKKYNLGVQLIIQVHALSNNLPELSLSKEHLAFWSSIGASIDFCLYLD